MQQYRISVGGEGCDILGLTNRHLQCAVDHVAAMGGGTVEISAGTFAMADSLHLRTGVTVRGQGDATVLRKDAMKTAAITCWLGFGHTDVCVDTPDIFNMGDGIWILDKHAMGFYTTVGTLIARDGDVWYTSRPHAHDYGGGHDGRVHTLFPVISAYDADDVVVEDLTVEGNAAENPVVITGCRGGGVFAMRCRRLALRRLTVRDYNSEGISFQTCDDVEVGHCLVEHCHGNGYHPGSGSNRFHIHDCVARHNGQSGLFYCLRVRHSLLENCLFAENDAHGVSTGSRNTDNVNRGLILRDNGGSGFYFRDDDQPNAAHRTTIEDCTLSGNGRQEAAAELHIQGGVDGVRALRNTIVPRPGVPAIVLGPHVINPTLEDNGGG